MPRVYVRKADRAYTRLTKPEMARLHDAIYAAAELEHPITLRGVFYRVVSAGESPKSKAAYDRIGREVLKMRREGRLPYSWIADGTRWTRKPKTHRDLESALEDTRALYRRRLWDNQADEVQIFSEKDAITGVIYPVTAEWDVPLCVVRGFSSETYLYSIAESIKDAKWPVYFYQLGDHDPSGVVAWDSIVRKIRAFVPHVDLHTERIAVTEDQIRGSVTGGVPLVTRPTDLSKGSKHARSKVWTDMSIKDSIEVDAIPPTILRRIVTEAIERHIDPEALAVTKAAEESEREIMGAIIGDLDDYDLPD